MANFQIKAFYNGDEQHDKFLSEIVRKHSILKEIYEVVDQSESEFEKNVGYEQIGMLIYKVKGVKRSLVAMLHYLEQQANELESYKEK